MKRTHLPLLLCGLLVASCTEKKEELQSEVTESVDLMPTEAEVQAINSSAEEAASTITEENADDALGALEAELEANDAD